MNLEENLTTRPLYRRALILKDQLTGMPMPSMERVKQITLSHCGPAVLESLFSYVGVKIGQRQVTKLLRTTKKIKRLGMNVIEMSRAAGALGKGRYSFWRKQNATIANLDTIINKHKYPVGVEWQGVFYENEDEDNGHYCIVTAIDRKTSTMRLADPYPEFYGVDRQFNINLFKKRWWDINNIKGRNLRDEKVMFVIVPKGDLWPKKLGMKKG